MHPKQAVTRFLVMLNSNNKCIAITSSYSNSNYVKSAIFPSFLFLFLFSLSQGLCVGSLIVFTSQLILPVISQQQANSLGVDIFFIFPFLFFFNQYSCQQQPLSRITHEKSRTPSPNAEILLPVRLGPQIKHKPQLI